MDFEERLPWMILAGVLFVFSLFMLIKNWSDISGRDSELATVRAELDSEKVKSADLASEVASLSAMIEKGIASKTLIEHWKAQRTAATDLRDQTAEERSAVFSMLVLSLPLVGLVLILAFFAILRNSAEPRRVSDAELRQSKAEIKLKSIQVWLLAMKLRGDDFPEPPQRLLGDG